MPYLPMSAPSLSGGMRINVPSPPEVGRPAISGFEGGAVQPVVGVQPRSANFARNNRASNVTIPHARVVAIGNASVPFNSDTTPTDLTTPGEPTKDLKEGQIGFVFARRSTQQGVPLSRMHLRSGKGVDRLDTMCSLTYLSRQFEANNMKRRITLSNITTLADKAERNRKWTSGTLNMVAKLDQSNNPAADTAITFDEKVTKMTDKLFNDNLNVGLFTDDVHPFIRGKSFATGLTNIKLGTPANDRSSTSNTDVALSIADQVAIALFQRELTEKGLFDWQPDGVVLSKDHTGADSTTEQDFDRRNHELYNVAVQGPASTTILAGESKLLVLPGDLVFVLMICDRVSDSDNIPPDATAATYEAWKTALPNENGVKAIQNAVEALSNKANLPNETLTNFRLRVSTSSEMVHTSGVHCFQLPPGTPWVPKPTERMGLKYKTACAEYIVGGWCVGRVLDAAEYIPAQFRFNSDPTSYAVNVDVNVVWWSGDRLARNFCDFECRTLGERHQVGGGGGDEPLSFMNQPSDGKTSAALLEALDCLFVRRLGYWNVLAEAKKKEYMQTIVDKDANETYKVACDKLADKPTDGNILRLIDVFFVRDDLRLWKASSDKCKGAIDDALFKFYKGAVAGSVTKTTSILANVDQLRTNLRKISFDSKLAPFDNTRYLDMATITALFATLDAIKDVFDRVKGVLDATATPFNPARANLVNVPEIKDIRDILNADLPAKATYEAEITGAIAAINAHEAFIRANAYAAPDEKEQTDRLTTRCLKQIASIDETFIETLVVEKDMKSFLVAANTFTVYIRGKDATTLDATLDANTQRGICEALRALTANKLILS